MMRRMRSGPPILTPAQQMLAIRETFPQFVHKGGRGRNTHIWYGELKPGDTTTYDIEIKWMVSGYPEVRVKYPEIIPNAPHRYEQDALCLFDPKQDDSWNP